MRVEPFDAPDQLRELARKQDDPLLAIRLLGVAMAMEKKTAPQVAQATGYCRRAVQQWVRWYNAEGIAGLSDAPGRGRKPPLLEAEVKRLCDRLDAQPRAQDGVSALRGRDVQRILREEFGKVRSLSATYYILHRLGYNDLMPRPRHKNADPAAQEAFEKKLPELIEEIRQAHPDKRLEVWFEDEARFGQQGTLTRVRAPVGSRPRAVRQTQYDYLYVLGACCPATGQTVGLLSPHLNTAVMNVFLEQLVKQINPEVHVVLIWDGAGYHKSRELKLPSHVTAIQLPPYSPELNPVENLWHYLRSHHWSNRAYRDYDALREAGCHAWQKACLNAGQIKTICRANYAEERR